MSFPRKCLLHRPRTGHRLPTIINVLSLASTSYMGQDISLSLPTLIRKLSPASTSYMGQDMRHSSPFQWLIYPYHYFTKESNSRQALKGVISDYIITLINHYMIILINHYMVILINHVIIIYSHTSRLDLHLDYRLPSMPFGHFRRWKISCQVTTRSRVHTEVPSTIEHHNLS